jgi:hypothetical protein
VCARGGDGPGSVGAVGQPCNVKQQRLLFRLPYVLFFRSSPACACAVCARGPALVLHVPSVVMFALYTMFVNECMLCTHRW